LRIYERTAAVGRVGQKKLSVDGTGCLGEEVLLFERVQRAYALLATAYLGLGARRIRHGICSQNRTCCGVPFTHSHFPEYSA
jgi:hypothetical protein